VVTVLSADGTLRHEVAEGLATGERVDPANVGWYSFGESEQGEDGTRLDLTDLQHVACHLHHGGDVLEVEVRPGISILVSSTPV
jgi:hypothetical protein